MYTCLHKNDISGGISDLNDVVANASGRSWQVAPNFFNSQFHEAANREDAIVEEPPSSFLNMDHHVSHAPYFPPRFGSVLTSIGAAVFGQPLDHSSDTGRAHSTLAGNNF